MTEAIQITVSNEMANRIEDNNSTLACKVREPRLTFMPSVETVIGEIRLGGAGRKKNKHQQKRRAFFRKTRLDVTNYYSLVEIQAMIQKIPIKEKVSDERERLAKQCWYQR